jgi:hypothetical protein
MKSFIKILLSAIPALAVEPNPPVWSDNVKLFDPTDDPVTNQAILDSIYQ